MGLAHEQRNFFEYWRLLSTKVFLGIERWLVASQFFEHLPD
jgi:hypothetical protein